MAKPKRWMAVPDNHGDMQDHRAVKACLEFARYWKPDIRVHLGDCFDFRALRRNASDQESRDRLGDDIEAGCKFLRDYKPTHWLRGNHDERIYDAIKSDDGKLSGFAAYVATEIDDATRGVQVLPYDKRRGVLKLGHLKFIHGYHSGLTAAKQAALVYGSVLMGHTHTIDHQPIPALEARMGRCIGCLCKLDHDYNRAHTASLRHAHGWAYGLLYPNGDYVVWQAAEIGGKFIVAGDVREI